MRERVDQLGVSEPQIQTTGGSQITVGLPDVSDVGAGREDRRQDRPPGVLRLGGERADAERQDRRQPAADPGSDARHDQPGLGLGAARATRARAACRCMTRSSSRPSSRAGERATTRASARSTTCSARPGAPPARPPPRTRARRRSPGAHCLLAGPDDSQADLLTGAAARASAPPRASSWWCRRGRSCSRPPTERQPADESQRPDAQFYVLKDHVSLFGNEITNPQQSTDQGGSPDVTFGFNSKGGTAFQNVTGDDRPARRARQRPRPDAQPALRGRARQPADHRPADRLQPTRTGSPAAAAPTSPAASRSNPRRTSRPSCASARCRST